MINQEELDLNILIIDDDAQDQLILEDDLLSNTNIELKFHYAKRASEASKLLETESFLFLHKTI